MALLVVWLSALVATTVAQDILRSYPVYSSMPNFDAQKYCGKWYQIACIPNDYQFNHDCTIVENSLTYNKTVSSTITSLNSLSGAVNKWSVIGVPVKGGYPSELDIYFPPLASQRQTRMTVLATDYVTYNVAVAVQVTENGSILEFPWILSRTRTLDRNTMDYALKVLHSNNVRISSLKYVKQDNCPAL